MGAFLLMLNKVLKNKSCLVDFTVYKRMVFGLNITEYKQQSSLQQKWWRVRLSDFASEVAEVCVCGVCGRKWKIYSINNFLSIKMFYCGRF